MQRVEYGRHLTNVVTSSGTETMATNHLSTLTVPSDVGNDFQTTELTLTPFAMSSFPTTGANSKMNTVVSTEDIISDTSGFMTSDTLTTLMTTLTSDPYPTSRNPTIDTTQLNDNMTKEDIAEYLEHLEKEELLLHIPAMIFIMLVALVGLFGNTLVLMVYKSKYRKNPTSIFIMAIAVFDLIANTVGIPGEVYDFFHLWTYTIPTLCRLIQYTGASTTITSACILLALAVARYRKICRPFGKQVTTRHAKIVIIGIVIFGWLISIPFGIIYGIHTKPTPRPGIVGHECNIDDAYVDTTWPLINSGGFLILFLSLCIPLVVLYTLIGIQAYKHRTIHGNSMVNMKASSTASLSTEEALDKPAGGMLSKILSKKGRHKKYEVATRIDIFDSQNSEALYTKSGEEMEVGESILIETKTANSNSIAQPNFDEECEDISLSREASQENNLLQDQSKIRGDRGNMENEANDTTDNEGEVIDEANAYQTKERRMHSQMAYTDIDLANNQHDDRSNKGGVGKSGGTMTKINQRDSVNNRTTIMLILITSLYVLSYVPYMVLIFFRFTQPDNFEAMGEASLATHHLFLRAFYLNSAANAVIYSLCDLKFRKEALKLIRCQK